MEDLFLEASCFYYFLNFCSKCSLMLERELLSQLLEKPHPAAFSFEFLRDHAEARHFVGLCISTVQND